MLISTTRFGKVEVEDRRVIEFPKGILGFPRQHQYVLLQTGPDSFFYWMQAIDREDLAFVVTDPSLFIEGYRVPIKVEQMHDLGLPSLEKAQVFVIVNKHEDVLTGNLQGPIVINVQQRVAEQLVMSDRRFTTRTPLMKLEAPVEAEALAV